MKPYELTATGTWIWLLSLIACYWTVTPAICLTLAIVCDFVATKTFEWRNFQSAENVADQLNQARADLEKLKSEMAAVQLKLGFSRG